MKDSWFFPDEYLREMEALVAAIYQVEGKTKKPDIKDVLLMAQAFGVYFRGQVDKAGGVQQFLRGVRKVGGQPMGRTELPNKRYYEFLRFVMQNDQQVEEVPEDQEVETGPSLAEVWEQLLDAYQEHAPKDWPAMVRRPKLAKMGTRVQEGIDYAGGVEEFVALFTSALTKVPDFYRNTYVRKNGKLRPALDCLLCLLSGDKNHKELGVAGWRMFEWADLIEAAAAPAPGTRHPSEEFISWTGTRWSYKDPFMADEEIERHKAALIAAGLAPEGS